jgi:hypothetical protein
LSAFACPVHNERNTSSIADASIQQKYCKTIIKKSQYFPWENDMFIQLFVLIAIYRILLRVVIDLRTKSPTHLPAMLWPQLLQLTSYHFPKFGDIFIFNKWNLLIFFEKKNNIRLECQWVRSSRFRVRSYYFIIIFDPIRTRPD